VLVDIDGPEVPILDGSSRKFVEGLLAAGIREQSAPLYAIEVLRDVEVRDGLALARLEPAPALEIDFAIEFDDAAIGSQRKSLNMANGAFVRELSDSRTFCRESDVEAMRAQGLALGGTFENAVVVNGADVLSPGGLRHKDEAVRHKMLDALGDLSLAGAPILGRYTGYRAGHAITNRL
jgi:UDP-3-O-[3-hydroxymyristoyl] N-acetylglucosamine deacetylase